MVPVPPCPPDGGAGDVVCPQKEPRLPGPWEMDMGLPCDSLGHLPDPCQPLLAGGSGWLLIKEGPLASPLRCPRLGLHLGHSSARKEALEEVSVCE